MNQHDPEDTNPRHEERPPPRRDYAAERAMRQLAYRRVTEAEIREFIKRQWPEKRKDQKR